MSDHDGHDFYVTDSQGRELAEADDIRSAIRAAEVMIEEGADPPLSVFRGSNVRFPIGTVERAAYGDGYVWKSSGAIR